MRRSRRLIAVTPLALLVAGIALAQGEDVDLKKGYTLSPPETKRRANDYMIKMRDTERRVTNLRDLAQKKKDVIKLNCVTDKLAQVKGHIAVAGQSMGALDTALQQSDDGTRQHEFMRLTILHQKVIVLGVEAENCIGQDVSYVGKTTVDVEIAPWVPVEDPTEPQLPLPDIVRPAEATPFV